MADQTGRQYPKNDLHALPRIEVSVGFKNLDLTTMVASLPREQRKAEACYNHMEPFKSSRD